MAAVTLGYSPCPNDTFIFYALVHGRIAGAPRCREMLADIETLNRMALAGELEMTKVSFHAFAHLQERYGLLRAGGALGRGCGPLVVSRQELDPAALGRKKVAIPGDLTTAALLLRLLVPEIRELVAMPFDQIMPAVGRGAVDAGVIIHEGRFTYARYGLRRVIDLGAWWEESTGHPLPLGGILVQRALGPARIGRLDRALRASVEYARAHPDEVRAYTRRHAQEMDDRVMQAHIDLYVNQYTLDYGAEGEAAIAALLRRAAAAGIAPASGRPLFAADA
jgi:1,4-dihydroxy-6-naphthoate synthase